MTKMTYRSQPLHDAGRIRSRNVAKSAIVGPEVDRGPLYDLDFGALTIPYLPGLELSVIMRGRDADTITLRTCTGQIALNLYAADAEGNLRGYAGSCIRNLSAEHVAPTDLQYISGTELAGTTAEGIHIRYAALTGPHWLLRAAIRTPVDHVTVHCEIVAHILVSATVRIPRHHHPGAVVEFSTNPTWIPRQ